MTEIAGQVQTGTPPYRDPTAPTPDRVQDLLSRMTRQEKLAQLGSVWAFELLDGSDLDLAKAAELLSAGIGHITRPAGSTNLRSAEAGRLADQIQRFLVEQTRLGIPAIVHDECLHGVLARDAVCFPQSIGQAATWDPSLVESMAAAIALRLRAIGVHQGLAPIFDVAWDPRWGRIEETYGEDPYLVAELGVAYVRGLQGPGPGTVDGVVATGKHLVGHGVPEGGRNQGPAHLGPRELRDVFLFPFEAAVRHGGIRSMMHAYDDVDGVPCAASRELLTTTLRETWGFDGVVVSDYMGVEQLVTLHELTADLSRAAGIALEAGVDVELPATAAFGGPLAEALERGTVDEALVDLAVGRLLAMKFELGLFERSSLDAAADPLSAGEERTLAREIARRSIVLLENDGTLPLGPDLGAIAVIGPNADSARNLLGDYSHVAHLEVLEEVRRRSGRGSASGVEPGTPEAVRGATILDAIRGRVSDATEIRYAPGCGILDGSDDLIEGAVAAARGADVAIVAVGERSGLTEDCTCGEFRDRLELSLPGRQEELVAAVAATGTPVVLVVVAGRPLGIEGAAGSSRAVLFAWVPGEEGPEAIADVLFGDVNPGGKLPVTVPRHVGQVPLPYSHKPSGGRSHWWEEYVEGSHLPLWPFGYGRSYTRFALRSLELDRPTIETDGEVRVSVELENTGDREGDEVVQLYVRDVEASVTRPVKELRGFRRVRLAPGECRRVTFLLAAEQLAFTGRTGELVVEPGIVRIMVGTSSEDVPCVDDLLIAGEPRILTERTRYLTTVTVA